MHTSNFTIPPLFDISVMYAKYLAHNFGSATEMIINITLVDDFATFNILVVYSGHFYPDSPWLLLF